MQPSTEADNCACSGNLLLVGGSRGDYIKVPPLQAAHDALSDVGEVVAYLLEIVDQVHERQAGRGRACVVVETFDESDLIGTVESAARRLRIERTEHQKKLSQWMDLYAEAYPEERRKDERLKLDVPVTIRGKDVLGEPFEEETLMLNVSAGGGYVRTENHVERNTGLQIWLRDPQVADGIFNMRGTVVRTDQGEDRLEAKRRRLAVMFADDVKQNIEFHLLLARLSDQVDKGSE